MNGKKRAITVILAFVTAFAMVGYLAGLLAQLVRNAQLHPEEAARPAEV